MNEDFRQTEEYRTLFERYKFMSDEELLEVIFSPDYTPISKNVAKDMLSQYRSTSSNTRKTVSGAYVPSPENECDMTEKEMFFEMNNNIRSIKNMLLFFVILTIIGLAFSLMSALIILM